MSLDDDLDRLYQLPLADFISERNEIVKRLKKEGDRVGAERVKRLVKPSLTAWAVNQLHFRAAEELEVLAAAGERLRTAQLGGAGTDHRAAMTARREAINELLSIAARVLEEGGHKLSRVHRQRISKTLQALASSPDGSSEGTAGRLGRDLEPPGFDAVTDLAAGLGQASVTPMPLRLRQSEAEIETTLEPAPVVDLEAARQTRVNERAEKQLEAARETVAGLEERFGERQREAEQAAADLAEARRLETVAAKEADEAARRARKAAKRAEVARDAVASARLTAESAETSSKRAEQKLRTARQKLEELGRQ